MLTVVKAVAVAEIVVKVVVETVARAAVAVAEIVARVVEPVEETVAKAVELGPVELEDAKGSFNQKITVPLHCFFQNLE